LIIDAHGGEIGYRPGLDGDGSTFYFRLPKKTRREKESKDY
jgi:K+-sensing histidine kinase KdpD